MVFGAYAAYLVDIMHSRSSEALAATQFVAFHSIGHFRIQGLNELLASLMRSIVVAIAIAAFLPMIDAYGIATTFALCVVFIWICFGYVFVPTRA